MPAYFFFVVQRAIVGQNILLYTTLNERSKSNSRLSKADNNDGDGDFYCQLKAKFLQNIFDELSKIGI